MGPLVYVLFVIAVVFYFRAWKYIRILVADVNRESLEQQFTTLRWSKQHFAAWRIHSRRYPQSPVRKQIVFSMVLAMLPMLGIMLIRVARGF